MRRLLTAMAGLLLAAAVLAFVSPAANADDDTSPPRTDPDAGGDSAAPIAAPAGPAAETTSTVSDEAEYRAAVIALSADPLGPHVIEIAASFTVDDGTDPEYTNLTEDLTINGNGFTITSGASDQRLLDLDNDRNLTVNDLTVVGFESDGSGGAISGDGGITVNNSTFRNNTAESDGGAIDVDDTATVNGSTFVDNHAEDGDGGAIDTSESDSMVEATDSTFTENAAEFEGGALSAQGDIFAEGSTFSGNEGEEGAAVGAYGSVGLINSTVTQNIGEFDIIDGTGDETGVGNVTLIYVTIADNRLGDEGVVDSDADGELFAYGTTISGTTGGTSCEAGDFSVVDSSHNRAEDDSCGFVGPGDVENAGDPDLGDLADNGGPTETRLPNEGSPLVDAIPEADCDAMIPDDQRGVSRPQDGDLDGTLGCDIGSVEVEGVVPPPVDPPAPEPEPEPGPIEALPPFTG